MSGQKLGHPLKSKENTNIHLKCMKHVCMHEISNEFYILSHKFNSKNKLVHTQYTILWCMLDEINSFFNVEN